MALVKSQSVSDLLIEQFVKEHMKPHIGRNHLPGITSLYHGDRDNFDTKTSYVGDFEPYYELGSDDEDRTYITLFVHDADDYSIETRNVGVNRDRTATYDYFEQRDVNAYHISADEVIRHLEDQINYNLMLSTEDLNVDALFKDLSR